MVKIGIVGGAGYTAGELLRIVLNHPEAEVCFVHSVSNAGNKLSDVHTDLIGETKLRFTSEFDFAAIDVLFSCLGHGDTKKFLEEQTLPKTLKIIDLSQDFRAKAEGNAFVYGLPELNREAIKSAQFIANPGCFATAIQLGLLPLAKAGLIRSEVHTNAITGSTGAGQRPSATSHFSWRNNNISVYKPFVHQHLAEIRQSLRQLQPESPVEISFLPVRGDFTRGIFTASYLDCDLSQEEAEALYTAYYETHPFVVVTSENPNLKQVVNTNKCLVHVKKHDRKLLVISCIDNLVKGASGQAVQNMNLLFGLDEKCGLRLKPSAF